MNNQATIESSGGRATIVLHVVQFLRGGGAETFVRELIPRLTQRGIDARVLCAYGDSQLTEVEAEAWTGIVYCQERTGVARLRYLNEMRRLMRQVSPDIVHTHTQVGAFWGRAAAMLEKVPIVVHTEHRSVDPLPILERAAHKFLNPRTDVTVTFSDRTAQLVRRREHIRDLYVIPNGIRIRAAPTQADRRAARQKLEFDPRCVVAGVVASLQAHKKPALAIDAIARLPSRTRDSIRLAFFGDGPLRGDLLSRAKDLGIETQVRFYGFRPDLEELLPGLDVIISTSAREMMPMSLLESMNAALPIIGAPHMGTLDLVIDGETGMVVPSWNADALAQAIGWAADHPEWRRLAGDAAHRYLKSQFDIEKVADRYVELYSQLLRRNRVAS